MKNLKIIKSFVLPFMFIFIPTLSGFSSDQIDNRNKLHYPVSDNSDSFISKGRDSTYKKVSSYCKKESYDKLGKWLSRNANKRRDLRNIFYIASDIRDRRLKNAAKATRKASRQELGTKISNGDLLQLALFVETKIKHGANNKKYYFDAKKSKIPRSIELDKDNNNIVVYLNKKDSRKLGKGKWKNFNTSLLYGVRHPEVIATGFLKMPKRHNWLKHRQLNEIKITKRLGDSRGIAKLYSLFKHRNISNKKDEVVYVEKLYRGGALREILGTKRCKFNTTQKIKLAFNLISGLRSMHRRGIVHRDLHTKNILLDISKKDGKKVVSGVITDFGRAQKFKRISTRLKKKSCSSAKRDIYRLGFSLYRIFHNESLESHRDTKKARKKNIPVRRKELKNKDKRLSLNERFELMILNMVNDDKKEIKDINEIFWEIKKIARINKKRR